MKLMNKKSYTHLQQGLMKQPIRKIIAIATLSVLGISSLTSYYVGCNNGFNRGYTQGYTQGCADTSPHFLLWREDDAQMAFVGTAKGVMPFITWKTEVINVDTIEKHIHGSITNKYLWDETTRDQFRIEYERYSQGTYGNMRADSAFDAQKRMRYYNP